MSAHTPEERPHIHLEENVTQFFRDALENARRAERIDATDATASYLVGLLADYARGDRTGETLRKPITLLLEEALACAGSERFERLRTIGDGVLYVNGFFSDHLVNRGVAVSYVNALGARAYACAARMLRQSAARAGTDSVGAPDVFNELADNFKNFVELLASVADSMLANSAQNDRSVLKLYERWLRTGSAPLAGALAQHGVLPLRGDGTLH